MTSTKKTTITVERERLYLWQTDAPQLFCDVCNQEVRMLRIEEAAKECGLSLSAICHLIETGQLHVREEGRTLLICAISLNEQRQVLASASESNPNPQ